MVVEAKRFMGSNPEIRGVWLTKTDSRVLDSQANIVAAMEFLIDTGFNVVFPVVWNQGRTLYPSQVMQDNFGIGISQLYQERDLLAEVVEAAHKVGLKVIPWFEYGFACGYNSQGGKIIAEKPSWAARERLTSRKLRAGNLLRKNGFEWMNALDPEVQGFMSSLILEVASNYDVDGIQGDDRLPAFPSEGGYDQATCDRYRRQFGVNPPHHLDTQWLQWRADILTEFWASLYQQLKAMKPNLIVSISPNIHDWAFKEYLQDTPTWLQRGIVDLIHPQIYRRDFPSYKAVLDRMVRDKSLNQYLSKFAPGILTNLGSYRISAEDLFKVVKYNRESGINGEVFFFYEGLRENDGELAKVLKENFYTEFAELPNIS
jgi:uncharacterized lipoprotein YddW (UPF0748 family)